MTEGELIMAKERLYISVTLVGSPLDEKQLAPLLTGFTRNSNLPRDNCHKKVHTFGQHEVELGFFPLLHLTDKESRRANYSFVRVFVLVFDLSKPDSLKELQEKYYPEIHEPHPQQKAFATILLGIRTTAENTNEALIAQASQFAAEKNIDIFMVRSLDNPASIREFVDVATTAGLKKQGKLEIANQCSRYLEHKKSDEDFVSFCLVMANASAPINQFKLILFLVAQKMVGAWHSVDTINAVINSVISYAAEKAESRLWKSETRATLFRANSHYTPLKDLLPDPEPTYAKALSL